MFLKENTQGRPPAPIALMPRHKYQITGLHFCELALTKNNERRIRLFAVLDGGNDDDVGNQKPPEPSILGEDPSNAGMLVFDTSVVMNAGGTGFAPSARHPPKVLDERGAAVKCSSLMRGTSELVVGRGEAVYNYSVEDRGGALAIFGEKLCVCAVGRYTLVVSVDEKVATPAVGTVTPNLSAGGAVVAVDNKPRKPNVNIYDLKNKIICGTTKKYQLPVGEKIVFVLHDGGCVYLVTSSWSLIRFREKDTSRKLDMLLQYSKPPLYSLAILVAAEEQVETAEIMKLYKLYGDHLYSKNEFDLAIVQYSHTIGYIPPSYVVMKFLDPYRIANLISYLEKLCDKGLATKDHITLLLTCYTKIKSDVKLKELLDGLATQKVGAGASAAFDAQQAIITLNSAGYSDYALQIAAKYHQHAAYLNIQLSKTPAQLDDSLGYLAYMVFVADAEDVLTSLKKHGRQLLKTRPNTFTALLVKLCTGDFAALLPVVHANGAAPVTTANKNRDANGPGEPLRALASLLGESVQLPKTSVPVVELLSLYCDDRASLLTLLEGVEDAFKGRLLPAKVSTTLMELYLHNYSVAKDKLVSSGKSAREMESALQSHEQNVMRILDGAYTSYDTAHALLLVHSFGFERGELYLLEKQQSVELVMTMLIESADSREVFKVLKREGHKDPELYIQVLTYFVRAAMEAPKTKRTSSSAAAAMGNKAKGVSRSRDSDDSDGERHSDSEEDDDEEDEEEEEDEERRWDSVREVMDLIERESILSPIQVISILAIHPQLPLQIAASFISQTLSDLTKDIDHCENQVRGALLNLEGINQSAEAQHQAKLAKAIKAQEKSLSLRNRQSMHQHRSQHYDDDEDEEEEEDETEEDEKAVEEKEQERWRSIRKAQLACSQEHEAFYKELELSADGFSTMSNAKEVEEKVVEDAEDPEESNSESDDQEEEGSEDDDDDESDSELRKEYSSLRLVVRSLGK
eukprot:gene26929-33580_t